MKSIFEKALKLEPLSLEEGLRLLKQAELKELQEVSLKVRFIHNPHKRVTYVVDTNPNYTNVCTAKCQFCAFQRFPGSKTAYTLNIDEIMNIIRINKERNVTTVLLQGGLHPDLPLEYYVNLVKRSLAEFPDINPHFFSAPEIKNIADVNGLTIREVLQHLWNAGQRSLPGGGAEILTESVRQKISPFKQTARDWLNVHETAHKIGFISTATMMFGHQETDEDILWHLDEIRNLQNKTNQFTAFIPWSYKPINKKTVGEFSRRDHEWYFRILAISRLYLNNFPHIQSSWFSEGKERGIESLSYGADDFGGTLFDENVHREASFVNKSNIEEVRMMIRQAGYVPAERNTFYDIINSESLMAETF